MLRCCGGRQAARDTVFRRTLGVCWMAWLVWEGRLSGQIPASSLYGTSAQCLSFRRLHTENSLVLVSDLGLLETFTAYTGFKNYPVQWITANCHLPRIAQVLSILPNRNRFGENFAYLVRGKRLQIPPLCYCSEKTYCTFSALLYLHCAAG